MRVCYVAYQNIRYTRVGIYETGPDAMWNGRICVAYGRKAVGTRNKISKRDRLASQPKRFFFFFLAPAKLSVHSFNSWAPRAKVARATRDGVQLPRRRGEKKTLNTTSVSRQDSVTVSDENETPIHTASPTRIFSYSQPTCRLVVLRVSTSRHENISQTYGCTYILSGAW